MYYKNMSGWSNINGLFVTVKLETQLSTNKLKSFDESYKAWMIYTALIEIVQESCYSVLLRIKRVLINTKQTFSDVVWDDALAVVEYPDVL